LIILLKSLCDAGFKLGLIGFVLGLFGFELGLIGFVFLPNSRFWRKIGANWVCFA